ncbi:MAG: NUDIX domain-containing protein, partial [Candidatus Kariarchaeaceae archaeon]
EFPAGRLEKGETLEDAISREAREEMGIEISSHDLIFAYTFDRNGTPLALLNYLCTYSGEITLSEEHDRGEWVDLDTARDRFVFEPQRELVDKIRHRLRID